MSELTQDLTERFSAIRLLVLDVDGVLTDGSITYISAGDEIKTFNVKDGQGLSYWNSRDGRSSAIITARSSPMVDRRAGDLGIEHIQQGIKPKLPALEVLKQQLNLSWQQIAYMGDDWPDIACLQHVGLATCPANAVTEVVNVCHWQSTYAGGNGAVRELTNHLLAAQGLMPDFN
jgi:3-deoxy-D-manno-octulosonate 8-phosphate phosphatase (KDO 8-P phosphatase)